jgi:TorA maturation chaperone TorD
MSAVLNEIETTERRVGEARRALAQDLLTLARLHDRELDRETIHGLWNHCYEDFLALRLTSAHGRDALLLFREGLTEIPTGLCQETMDRLAAEYADIYLNYGLRASPSESVWLDQDNLAMQGPMFAIRHWYGRHGLTVSDWRKRSDDHLVNQLQFVAFLLESDDNLAAQAARFLDEHPLRWIEQFATRVAQRCSTRIYAGLALLTAAYLDELRDLLAEILREPRPTAEEVEARLGSGPTASVPVEGPYLPGAAPSW